MTYREPAPPPYTRPRVLPIIRDNLFVQYPFWAPFIVWVGPTLVFMLLLGVSNAFGPRELAPPKPDPPPVIAVSPKKYPCYFVAPLDKRQIPSPWDKEDWRIWSDDSDRNPLVDTTAPKFTTQLDAWNFLLKWKVETCK